MHTYRRTVGTVEVLIMVNQDWSGDAIVVVEDEPRNDLDSGRKAQDTVTAINLVNGVVPERGPYWIAQNPPTLTSEEWGWAIALAARLYAFHEIQCALNKRERPAVYTPPNPRVLVHADGGACHGTPLVDGRCPNCGISPDMQSTELWPAGTTRQ